MYIRELSVDEFNNFKKNHPLNNYHQTVDYALLKSENDYEYEIIGYTDGNEIHAAALVLVKMLDGYIYAYVPEGFIMNYFDENLLQRFTDDLIKYYKKEDIIFIKINPSVIIGEIDSKTKTIKYNKNIEIINKLESHGYKKLEETKEFDTVLPQINAVIDLNEFSVDNLSKNTKNKIRKAIRKGLTFERANESQLSILNNFVKKKRNKDDFYYNDYYNIFSRKNAVDFFLVSIDYEKYILNAQDAYEKELSKNELLNAKLRQKPGNKNINKKMNSDKTLLSYKNDISIASKNLNTTNKEYIAGALVIKEGNKAYILISGFDKKYKSFAANYFMYYSIINYYKNELDYLNIGGISNNFSKDSKYHGLNTFKLGFNPKLYKYAGEFDLIIRPKTYNYLDKKGYLEKEFNNH